MLQEKDMIDIKVRIGNLINIFTTGRIRRKDMPEFNKHLNYVMDFIEEKIKNSSPSDNNDFKKPCPNCNGTGRMIEIHTLRDVKFDCLTCKGQGFIKS